MQAFTAVPLQPFTRAPTYRPLHAGSTRRRHRGYAAQLYSLLTALGSVFKKIETSHTDSHVIEKVTKRGGKKHSRTDSEHVFLCCEQGASSSDCMCPNSPKVSLKLSIAERLQSSSKDSHYFSADTCLFTLVKIHLLDLITGDWITLCCLCAVDSPWRKGAHQ